MRFHALPNEYSCHAGGVFSADTQTCQNYHLQKMFTLAMTIVDMSVIRYCNNRITDAISIYHWTSKISSIKLSLFGIGWDIEIAS